jgi:hypothetical protein
MKKNATAARLPDFSFCNTPKSEKNQMTIKYTTLLQNIPNGRKIYQHLQLQDHPKFTQIPGFLV